MRKWLIVLLLVGTVFVMGCAKEAEARGYKGDICDSPLGSILNECVQHPKVNHPSEDKALMPIGVGIDLILYESDVKDITYKITAEYKYDLRNSEHEIYGVVTLKLMDIIQKIKGDK